MSGMEHWKITDLDPIKVIEGGDPWGDWLEAVGIDDEFPTLGALRRPYPDMDDLGNARPNADSKRWFLNRPHMLQVAQIYQSLHAARVVTTAPGHGATSLARHLYLKAEVDALIRRSIPVLVSLEDLIPFTYSQLLEIERKALGEEHPRIAEGAFGLSRGIDESSEDFGERREMWAGEAKEKADRRARVVFESLTVDAISSRLNRALQTAVIRSLLTRQWELSMGKAGYRDLIGAASPQPRDIMSKRQELAKFVFEDPISDSSLRHLRSAAPKLVPDDYRTLIAFLNRACGVRISLLLDLSATPAGRFFVDDIEGEYLAEPYLEALQRVANAIKNLEQHGERDSITPPLPSLLDKTYFMSHGAWAWFDSSFSQQAEELTEFPPYRPIDAFAMLAYHYPPHQDESGRRAEAMAAVVDSRFVQINPRRSLSAEMAMLRDVLRAQVARDGDLTYQIDAAPSQQLTEEILPRIIAGVIRLADLLREPGGEDSLHGLGIRELERRFSMPKTDGDGGISAPNMG